MVLTAAGSPASGAGTEPGSRAAISSAHVPGANAEEIINVFALALRNGLTVDQTADSVWAYPTASSDVGHMA